ncbi:oxaloacetate decarboxylase [bacterium]|nr:oxaloacetate decarboxylase [bacterium]
MTHAEKIREILTRGGRSAALLMPGVFDALTARLAVQAGFEVIFTSGYSVSAARLAAPDFGVLTATEMIDTARRVCLAEPETPLIVDADTGYGNAINVIQTVKELQRAGAAGMFLEDQVWPKKCGHMSGKVVIPLEEYESKLQAAIDTRGDRDFFIVARTDARAPLGLKEAIRRAKRSHEMGADATFIEAPQSIDEMREIAREVPGVRVANMLEKGKTPLQTPQELHDIGFDLIVHPLTALYAAARAYSDVFRILKKKGTTREDLHLLLPWADFHGIVDLEGYYELEKKYRER